MQCSIAFTHNGIKHNSQQHHNLIHIHCFHATSTKPYVQTHPSHHTCTYSIPTHHLSYHVCVSTVHVSTNHYTNVADPSHPCVRHASTHQRQSNMLSCSVHDMIPYDSNACVLSPLIPNNLHSVHSIHSHSCSVISLHLYQSNNITCTYKSSLYFYPSYNACATCRYLFSLFCLVSIYCIVHMLWSCSYIVHICSYSSAHCLLHQLISPFSYHISSSHIMSHHIFSSLLMQSSATHAHMFCSFCFLFLYACMFYFLCL